MVIRRSGLFIPVVDSSEVHDGMKWGAGERGGVDVRARARRGAGESGAPKLQKA